MTISFAGVTLLLEPPNAEVEQHIARYWSLPTSPINTPPRKIDSRTLCQIPNWPSVPPLKLNMLYQPSGATRWSRGLFLTDDEGMRQLYQKSYGLLKMGLEYPFTVASANSSGRSYSPGSVVSPGQWDIGSNLEMTMFKLDPIPISVKNLSSSGASAENWFYIIPLVDERYFWQGINITTTATSWIGGSPPSSSSSGSSNGITGRGLFGDLAQALSVGALGSPLPHEYISGWFYPNGHPSYKAFRNGEIPAAAAMDLLCWSQNLLLVPDDHTNVTTTGDEKVQRYRVLGNGILDPSDSSSATRLTNRPLHLALGQRAAAMWESGPGSPAGNEKFAAIVGLLSAVGYDYPRRVNMSFFNPDDLDQKAYVKEVTPNPVFDMVGQGTMSIKCLASADELNDLDEPSNKSALDDIADRWAGAWYYDSVVQFDWSFNLMPRLKFIGVDDYILLDMSKHRRDYGTVTRWKSLPVHYGYEYVAIEGSSHKDDQVTTQASIVGCGNCSCFDCVTDAQAVVTTCEFAPDGAPMNYDAFVGYYVLFPDLGGILRFTYGFNDVMCSNSSSSSVSRSSLPTDTCTWSTCLISVCVDPPSSSSSSSSSSGSGVYGCGLYQWQLIITALGVAEWELHFLSGTDVVSGADL